jgi:predicted 2-oxoglutarate/Fe(II)-dependent dioxygenase YbiX
MTTKAINMIAAGRELIVTIPDLISADECRALIHETEARGYDPAPITTPLGFVSCPEIRCNTRVMRDDEHMALDLWQRLHSHVPARWGRAWHAAGLNERFRFYRYETGEFFRWHVDGAFHRSGVERSMLTAMVYLNDDFDGGTTDFHTGISVTPRQGMALVFAHHWLHQGAPPTTGRKYVMRTDVMYRRATA